MIDIDLDQLPATNVQTVRQSFAASSISFSLPYDSGSAPYEKFQECRVWQKGSVILLGPVTECEASREAEGDLVWNIEISDRWYWLEACSYVTEMSQYGTAAGGKVLVPMCVPGGYFVMVDKDAYKPKPDKSDTYVPPTIAMGAAFTDILDNSRHFNCKLRLDFEHTQEMIPFEAGLSYLAGLMRNVQQWRPGLTSRFDYSDPDNPEFVITDKGNVVMLDAGKDDLTLIDLAPRPDLIPPVVGVIGVASTGSQSMAYTMASYPSNSEGKFKDPYAMLMSVSLPAGTQTDANKPSRGAFPLQLIGMTPEEALDLLGIPAIKTPAETTNDVLPRVANMLKYNADRVILRGKRLPTDAKGWETWWMEKAPQYFKGVQIDIRNNPDVTVTTPDAIYSNHVAEKLDYEWVSGQYNGVGKGVKWTALQITQKVYIKNPPDRIKSRFPVHAGGDVYMGEFSCYIHVLGYSYRSYALDADGSELPNEGGYEPEIEPEEDEGSGDDPVQQDKTASEAIPRYDDVVRQVWESSQKLEHEGSIRIVGKGLNIRPGDRINIANDRPEYATMETTVQSVTIDEFHHATTLGVGPASHISLQTAAERARTMSSQVNRAKSETDSLVNTLNKSASDDPSETPGTSDTPSVDPPMIYYPARQRPTAAEIGPCFRLLDSMSGKVDIEADFSVRGIWSSDGRLTGSEWYGGKVYGPRDEKTVGNQNQWNPGGPSSGSLYCNISLDKEGRITSAEVSTSSIDRDEGKIWATGKLGIDNEEYRPKATGWEGEPAKISVLIASISENKIVHHRLGAIFVSFMPWYAMLQLDDANGKEKEQNPSDEFAGSDTPPVSLICKKDDDKKWVKFRQIQAGRGIKLRLRDQTKDGMGTIKLIGEKYKFVNADYDPSATPGTEPEKPSTGGPVGDPDDTGISILSTKEDSDYANSDTEPKKIYFRKVKAGPEASIMDAATGEPRVLQIRVEDDTLIFDFPVGTATPST